MDEVGGNINQKGDGNIEGQLQLCEIDKTPQQKVSSRDKHYTILGLTILSSEPIICIIIFAGKCHQPLIETGLDLEAEVEGNEEDDDFFAKNSGKEKRFPMRPTCTFKGKEIPYLC